MPIFSISLFFVFKFFYGNKMNMSAKILISKKILKPKLNIVAENSFGIIFEIWVWDDVRIYVKRIGKEGSQSRI